MTITNPPQIRVLPMSTELEFPTLADVHEFFLEDIPTRDVPGQYFYRRSTIRAPVGALVLFQYQGSIIAHALLESDGGVAIYDDPVYSGYLVFDPASIVVYERPVTQQQFDRVWPGVRFSQARHNLPTEHYAAYLALLRETRNETAPFRGARSSSPSLAPSPTGVTPSMPPLPREVRPHLEPPKVAHGASASMQSRPAAGAAAPAVVSPAAVTQPRRAWLLIGSDQSFLDEEDLATIWRDPDHGWFWNGSPHIRRGDTVLIYYIAPRKAAHFVGRVNAIPEKTGWSVEANDGIRRAQNWFPLADLVEVAPLPFEEICRTAGELLILKGQSGKYLRPETANTILSRVRVLRAPPDDPAGRRALDPLPIGIEPGLLTLADLCALDPRTMVVEQEVERLVVEPLLRLADVPPAMWRRRVPAGGGIADYLVGHASRSTAVIEVKHQIPPAPRGSWEHRLELRQARRYTQSRDAAVVLIDRTSIFGFEPRQDVPALAIERAALTPAHLTHLRRLVLPTS